MEKIQQFLDVIEDLISGICLLFLTGVVAFIIVFFGAWIALGLAGLIVLFFLAWAVGIPITVKKDGTKVGYVRWTKFYPTSNKPWE